MGRPPLCEQITLFDFMPVISAMVRCFDGAMVPVEEPEPWMKALVPDGEYVVPGEHPLVLRPVKTKELEIQPGLRYLHYLAGSQVYAGIYVGKEEN